MHPCHVCGSTEIDPVGYCRHCRAFQAAVSYEAAAPAGTVYGAPYEDRYAYHAAEPDSVPPAQPTSGAPQAIAPSGPRHRLVMPLFVLTVVALLLTSGTLVVLVFNSDLLKGAPMATTAPDNKRATPSAPPSSAAPVLEGCLVGTWKTVSVQQLLFDQDGNVLLYTSEGGSTLRMSTDGTASEDLGGIKYQMKGTKRTAVGAGTVSFTVRPTGTTLVFTDVKANAAYTYYENGKSIGTVPVPSKPEVFEYACGDNTLQLYNELAQYELRRG